MSNRFAAMLCVAATATVAPRIALGLDMGSLWPNADRTSWTYQQHREQISPAPPVVIDNVVRLLLDGTTVAPNGIAAQVLRGEALTGATSNAEGGAARAGGFLGNLWQARPDLRAAIQSRVLESGAGTAACPETASPGLCAIVARGDSDKL